MIAERGVAGLSLRAVARQVGATTGLVNHHFADRAELVSAALDHAADVMSSRVTDLGADAHPVDVFAAALPTDEVTIENWRFVLAIRSAALVDPELRRFDQIIADHWHGALPAILGAHTELDPHDAGDILIAVVDGVALRSTLDPDDWPVERQRRQIERAFASIAASAAP